jgi:hypothetical protein
MVEVRRRGLDDAGPTPVYSTRFSFFRSHFTLFPPSHDIIPNVLHRGGHPASTLQCLSAFSWSWKIPPISQVPTSANSIRQSLNHIYAHRYLAMNRIGWRSRTEQPWTCPIRYECHMFPRRRGRDQGIHWRCKSQLKNAQFCTNSVENAQKYESRGDRGPNNPGLALSGTMSVGSTDGGIGTMEGSAGISVRAQDLMKQVRPTLPG